MPAEHRHSVTCKVLERFPEINLPVPQAASAPAAPAPAPAAAEGGNTFSDVGATALARALKTNTCLRELDLVSAGGARGGGWAVVAAVMRGVATCGCVIRGV